jgi:hypothetical protein
LVAEKRETQNAENKTSNSQPLLTDDGLQWAKKHRNLDWNQVIFTDESTFQLYLPKEKKDLGSSLEIKIYRKFILGCFSASELASWDPLVRFSK